MTVRPGWGRIAVERWWSWGGRMLLSGFRLAFSDFLARIVAAALCVA